MKITTLIEDTKKDPRFINEFGLSFYIETDSQKILLDMGGSEKFILNSQTLGLNIKDVDMAIISHAHSDHGGGLGAFLEENSKSRVYLHQKSQNNYYGNIGARLPLVLNTVFHPFVKTSKSFSRSIGLDLNVLSNNLDRLTFIDQSIHINQEVSIIEGIQQKQAVPAGNRFLLAEKNGRLQPDTFDHELILIVNETDGMVIFSGCCHNGILNMIDTAKKHFPDTPIKAVVGGFHLKLQPSKEKMAGSKQDIQSLARDLKKLNIPHIYTGHCTGDMAFGVLKRILGNRLERLYTGFSFKI